MAQRDEANKNAAKRAPTSAVFTVDAESGAGSHILGFIEGNVALTRVMLIVEEAFDSGTIDVTDFQGGTTETHFTAEDLAVEGVVTALTFVPVTGTIEPLYRKTRSQWDCVVAMTGTKGKAMVVVEYTQLDTEPGLHTATVGG